jgi:trans-aconitate 2-methyltransferase
VLRDGGPGGGALGDAALVDSMARKWVLDAEEYYDLLAPLMPELDIWHTEYLQVLEGEDPVLEGVKATGLRPVLNGLGDAEREQYLATYRQRLRAAYPRRADGHTLYPFRRLFIVGRI